MTAGRAFASLIPLFLASSLALAEDSPPAEKAAPAAREAPASPAPPAKGLVVFVDPVTGKIRQPDAAEIGALTAPPPGTKTAKPAPEAPLLMKYGPGTAVGVVLDSRYESFMVATKAPDGKVATECVTGGRAADAAVAAGAPPAGKTEKAAKKTREKTTEKTTKNGSTEAVRVP